MLEIVDGGDTTDNDDDKYDGGNGSTGGFDNF